jgi:amidase
MDEPTIVELQQRMNAGELTARGVALMYLARVEELDRRGPHLNAVIELNPDALAIADALDDERRSKGPRGPLHGIPVMLKDNIDTADRMQTTAGSLALEGSVAAQDAFVAKCLREVGAVILGKTNLSEWANFRSSRSTSGWSSRGGQTRNPYALDRNPCGSSSGSGVAVAAGLCAAAVGTETDGSIICPAQTNGIVGIKPTVGLVSRSGIIPIAHSQDTAGPMARTVADAAILLGALTGVDTRDPLTLTSHGKSHADYTPFLDPSGLRGARIGVARNLFGENDKIGRVMDGAVAAMRKAGAEIVDPVEVSRPHELGDAEFTVLLYEFKADLNAYLAGLGPESRVHSLKDVIAFNEAHRDTAMPYFGQETMLQAEEKGDLTSEEYRKALETCRRLSRAEGLDAALDKHKLDALVVPSGLPASLTDLVNGDPDRGGPSSPAAVAGYPTITVPAGFVFGLPVGISFIGAAYSEPVLIKLAYAFEQLTRVRRPPQFLPTVELG